MTIWRKPETKKSIWYISVPEKRKTEEKQGCCQWLMAFLLIIAIIMAFPMGYLIYKFEVTCPHTRNVDILPTSTHGYICYKSILNSSKSNYLNCTGNGLPPFIAGNNSQFVTDVDLINNKIYSLDIWRSAVYVAELKNSKIRSTPLPLKLINPKSIALDSSLGLMFITDGKRIIRANMDGTNSRVINVMSSKEDSRQVSYENGWGAITIDDFKKRIYVVDKLENQVVGFDYAGNKFVSEIKYRLEEKEIDGVSFFKDTLFFTTRYPTSIFQVNVTIGWKSVQEITTEINPLFKVIQRPAWNPCTESTCEQMCVLSYNISLNYSCACYSGWYLHDNKINCVQQKEFFIYTDGSQIIRRTLDGEIMDGPGTGIGPVSNLRALAFSVQDENVFFMYKGLLNVNILQKAHINRKNSAYITQTMDSGRVRMSYDWLTNYIYSIQFLDESLIVYTHKKAVVSKQLIYKIPNLEDLAVDPIGKYIIFSENNPSRISHMDMYGITRNVTDVLKIGKATSLTIDFKAKRLLWLNPELGKIQYRTLDGGSIKTLNLKTPEITNNSLLTMYNDKYYIYDGTSRIVWNVMKNDMKFVFSSEKDIIDLKVFGKHAQPMDKEIIDKTPCAVNNGNCRYICFSLPTKNETSRDESNKYCT